MNTEVLEKNVPVSAPERRGYVLVVDDEEHNRALLRDTLEAHGYEIMEAASGREALDQISERQPDVILLDVMMSRMDGFEVCRQLKRDAKTAAIPVLMVTALSERKERMMGIAAGANDFLSKPVDIQDMILRVRNAVQMRRLFDQLQAERKKSERLLLNILPPAIAVRMAQGETNIAEHHPDVTVLVADLVGFTTLTSHISPEQVVSLLNEIFSAFDEQVGKRGLEKIKTIGDAYMVVGGMAVPRKDHADVMAKLALDLRSEIDRLNEDYNTSIRIRIGMCTGPLIGGVIGRRKFSFDLWGATVNLACRLEATSEPGTITVSESTFERLRGYYRFQRKEGVLIKGVGEVTTYQLLNRI